MRRKRLWLSLGLVGGVVVAVATGMAILAKRVPSFYAQAEMAPGYLRETRSREADGAMLELKSNFRTNSTTPPHLELTAEQLNAFFQDDFLRLGLDESLPPGLSAPRVKFEDGRVRIGLRYGKGWFSAVLSIEIRVWMVPGQYNLVAMEIVSLRAGGLPISPAVLLDDIAELLRRWNVEVTWYRNESNPVAVLRFQGSVTRATYQIDHVSFTEGKMAIAARSTAVEIMPMPREVSANPTR